MLIKLTDFKRFESTYKSIKLALLVKQSYNDY